MRSRLLQRFIQLESASGLILLIMAALALVWANSPGSFVYQQFVEASSFVINDGLMVLFFLTVGLELKREYINRSASGVQNMQLPLIAAGGGMVAPALIYGWFNYHDPILIKGWAIPVATDIAFAVGVLSLFGRRVPVSLRLFLLALAIYDDLGAIMIIAVWYNRSISILYLLSSGLLVLILCALNRWYARSLIPYLILGMALWYCLWQAGIHPTLTGVILAFAIPASGSHASLSQQLENRLHPYVAYGVMPLFALANAGFSFAGMSWGILGETVVLGIALGLFIGKQLGILGVVWLLVRCKLAKMPTDATWLGVYGTVLLCGIGFTMSLFLGTLSFQNEPINYLAEVRLGVILGSLMSGVAGALVLAKAFAKTKPTSWEQRID